MSNYTDGSRKASILHISLEEKFVDAAMDSFEDAFPEQNEFILFKTGKSFTKGEYKNSRIVNPLIRFDVKFIRSLKKYDVVVLHSLSEWFLPIVFFSSKDIKFIWIGWGYDYYPRIASKNSISYLLKDSLKLDLNIKANASFSLKRLIGDLLKAPFSSDFVFKKCIKKIDVFSPVLEEEHFLLKKSFLGKDFPRFEPWNYGSIEGFWLKGFLGEKITGNNILLGNSASALNNHIEAISLISEINIGSREVVVPLSYGSKDYGKAICKVGKETLGDNFKALTGFMPFNDYLDTIKSCGFVIMNHLRQQAVGNVIIMLYLGAKVFLQEDSPVYSFFKSRGAFIFTVQQLEADYALLDSPLSDSAVNFNRRILMTNWSSEKIYQKTKNIVFSTLNLNK